MAAIKLTRAHRVLIGIVLAGAVVIAAIGFVGSYSAVRDLAERKGFGAFSPFFPIGVDAGIVVLLALDLLLTWLRIPFPLLRQSAWLLTAATIAFNGAAAWGDPLGVGMHAIIPVLFVITVEAARHAIGRIADITADRHMEGVRMWRWFLSPIPTFRLWRRMKLWELRSYQEVIGMERDRLVYQAQLRAEYGRAWRRRAPVEARMPLKLARYGVPLRETADTGLRAARIRPAVGQQRFALLPQESEPAAGSPAGPEPRQEAVAAPAATGPSLAEEEPAGRRRPADGPDGPPVRHPEDGSGAAEVVEDAVEPPAWPRLGGAAHGAEPAAAAEEFAPNGGGGGPTVEAAARAEAAGPVADIGYPGPVGAGGHPEPVEATVTVPVGPGRRRALGSAHGGTATQEAGTARDASPRAEAPVAQLPDAAPPNDAFYDAYRQYVYEQGSFPNARQLSRFLHERFAITDDDGTLLSEQYLRSYTRGFRERYSAEMGTGV
ncbi:DUF2637 domain-containing protein [Streptomyces sp. DSM 44915]|uniref:DUF2637 domain-containing protein n=1 Tax=Streptomyces chisholmiae TaxID=3075540 RepID=A0ABU2K021_9ACTN|nr:DUF2637 domain-containing protein [Streptomyces sp. DSM 44915]MDT0270358.1 DUF2637 domain-containing protein [Streptomyces sp. DSM 44915]